MLNIYWIRSEPEPIHDVIGVPLQTRLQRVVRYRDGVFDGWILWVSTRDYQHGTSMMLDHNGCVVTITSRKDEGDEIINVRPRD